MACRRRSEAEPSRTLDISLYRSKVISGSGQTRAPPASPDAWTEQSECSDFGDSLKPSKRSSTYPFVPPGPFDAHVHKSPRRASNLLLKLFRKQLDIGHNSTGPPHIRYASTIDTNHSASFEDTAVWDEKAILSLGTYPFLVPGIM